MLASFATKTGRSNLARRPSASSVPRHPRLGASSTTPAASTTPGLPTPMPSSGQRRFDELTDQAVHERHRVVAAAPLERLATAVLDDAAEVQQRTGDHTVCGQVDGDHLARALGHLHQHQQALPTRPGAAGPLWLGEQPLGDQVADDVGDGHAGQPAGPREVGTAGRSVAEEQLEQQRAVVTAGVLGQQPA